ncbi:MAG: hypothetical protein ACFB16_11070 [Phormidesmis sp.]
MEEFVVPTQLGRYHLLNRLVIGTRCRLKAENYCPCLGAEDDYAQFAPSALIISEPILVDASNISTRSNMGDFVVGLFDHSHIEAWRKINRAVHKKGGKIFAQLWHSANLPCLCAIHPELEKQLPHNSSQQSRPLLRHQDAIDQFRRGAQLALAADFDGIEIHGALSLLSRQLGSSQLSADYMKAEGINIDDAALLLELADVLSAIWDGDRLGIFLSCSPEFSGADDIDPEATLYSIVDSLRYTDIAYIHMGEVKQNSTVMEDTKSSMLDTFRSIYRGVIVFNSEQLGEAVEVLKKDRADFISLSDTRAKVTNAIECLLR